MNIKKITHLGISFFAAKIFRRRIPLVVGWAITDRCNQSCSYCGRRHGDIKEISTQEAFRIIDELSRLGCLRISLTGGEPLMREDIGAIVDRIHKKGIETKINSNGALVRERIDELKNLDILCLSLEGEKDVHDAIRGAGSYDKVIEAAQCARERGIKISFATVLTKRNLDSIDFILAKAKEFDAKVK